MGQRVYVAAGGGGDAIACWALHRAESQDRPVIATFAWDRLMVDPVPGPRSVSDFDGLVQIDALNYAITADTRPRAPAGSTLPRLAHEIDAELVLLDPANGAAGLRDQLRSLVATEKAEGIVLVDVGGDLLAEGHEEGLRSPLADSLALAATAGQTVPVEVWVVGAGLDGELPASAVREHVSSLTGTKLRCLAESDVEPILSVLDWHPSEATALTVAAALGLRGKVEMRGQGHAVELTDHSPDIFSVEHGRLLRHSKTTAALLESASLDEAELAVRETCSFSELDYERQKATERRLHSPSQPLSESSVNDALRYAEAARGRGVRFLTFRRLAEVVAVDAAQAGELREALQARQPGRYQRPLWSTGVTCLPQAD